ncbi:MAG: PEP-CTERM sorting domain-containing protein [Planctomycetes bacterium]|nr:PEP-CTERM sorting domain-containing protein [Planctomycetota bacterium]
MSDIRVVLFNCVLLLSVPHSGVASEISVDAWLLQTLVDENGVRDSDGSFSLTNPFSAQHNAAIGISTAHSIISASWNSSGFLQFLLDAQHAAAGSSNLFSRSTGTIYVTPQVDSFVSIALQYDYALGSGIREAIIQTAVSETNGDALLYHFDFANTLVDPSVGQLDFDSGGILLSAGVQYWLQYQVELHSFSGSPTSLSHGNGHVAINISPVPEPATLFLISAALPLLFRRRRR